MSFMGFGPTLDSLKNFAFENSISNVRFTGRYKKEEEEKLLVNTDFINILISKNKFNNGVISNRGTLGKICNDLTFCPELIGNGQHPLRAQTSNT